MKHGGVSSECVIHSVKASVKNCLYLEGLGRCIDVRTSYAHARGWANSRNIATNYISGEVSPSASVAIRAYREVMSALFEQILLVLVGLFRTFTKKIDKVVKRSVNKVYRKG